MTEKNKRALSILALVLWDIFSVLVAVFVAFRTSYASFYKFSGAVWYNPFSWVPSDVNGGNLALFIAMACVGLVLLNIIFRNYTSVLRHAGIGEMLRVVMACLVFSVSFFVVSTMLQYFRADYIIIMCLIMTILQVAGRSSAKLYRETAARMSNLSKSRSGELVRTLIFGAGEAGAFFCNKSKNDKSSNILPVVFIDDDKRLQKSRIHGVKVYGGHDKLAEAIDKFHIDEVIVAIPTATKELLNFTLDVCKQKKIKVRRFGNIDDVDMAKVSLTQIDIEDLLKRDSVHLNMNIVRKFIEDKVVLVTGGAGSIGSEICRQVLGFGCKHLVILDFNENGLYYMEQELKEKYTGKFDVRLGSIRDKKRLSEVFDEFEPQIVFHAAAHKHVPMMEYCPKEAVKNNVKGTINVATASIVHHVEKFILISTDKAVNPTNVMGASKRIAEMAIQMLNTISETDFSAVRFGNVLGSNGSIVPLFRKQIEQGGPVTVTHPDIRRFFMTIPEAVQLVLEAGAMAQGGEIFVLNMGEPVKIYDLACDLIRLSGLEPNVDIKIEFIGLRPGEKLYEEISLVDETMDKTPNDKIFIMQPMEFDSTSLSQRIKELESSAVEGNLDEMFDKIKELVPTFDHNTGTVHE
ncbi:MAG: polysaccharide biosynthesis protein [Acutalibacteraceae bacterium]